MARKKQPAIDHKAFLRQFAGVRVGLLNRQPFYGTLAMHLNLVIVEDPAVCPVMSTDGINVFLNPQGIMDKCPRNTWEGCLAHEVLHAALNHCDPKRVTNRDPKRWNTAADIVVNHLVMSDGLTLPGWVIRDYNYKDETVEQVYARLPENTDISTEHEDIRPANPGDETAATVNWDELIISAQDACKRAGKEQSKAATILADNILSPKIDWVAELAQFLTATHPATDDWSRPHRRSITQGFYHPSKTRIAKGNIAIAIDTSASLSMQELTQIKNEVAHIKAAQKPEKVTLYLCDYVLRRTTEFFEHDEFEFQFQGGGGTSFRPVFEAIAKLDEPPECIVYFTDGEAPFTGFPIPTVPLLWGITGNTKIVPPFGITIPIER